MRSSSVVLIVCLYRSKSCGWQPQLTTVSTAIYTGIPPVWEIAVHLAVACDVYDGVFCAVLFPTRCLG